MRKESWQRCFLAASSGLRLVVTRFPGNFGKRDLPPFLFSSLHRSAVTKDLMYVMLLARKTSCRYAPPTTRKSLMFRIWFVEATQASIMYLTEYVRITCMGVTNLYRCTNFHVKITKLSFLKNHQDVFFFFFGEPTHPQSWLVQVKPEGVKKEGVGET